MGSTIPAAQACVQKTKHISFDKVVDIPRAGLGVHHAAEILVLDRRDDFAGQILLNGDNPNFRGRAHNHSRVAAGNTSRAALRWAMLNRCMSTSTRASAARRLAKGRSWAVAPTNRTAPLSFHCRN